jgi:hypothetical protein
VWFGWGGGGGGGSTAPRNGTAMGRSSESGPLQRIGHTEGSPLRGAALPRGLPSSSSPTPERNPSVAAVLGLPAQALPARDARDGDRKEGRGGRESSFRAHFLRQVALVLSSQLCSRPGFVIITRVTQLSFVIVIMCIYIVYWNSSYVSLSRPCSSLRLPALPSLPSPACLGAFAPPSLHCVA